MWTFISRLYRQRHQKQNENNLPEMIQPQQGGTKAKPKNIMRWEDDGGLIINEVAESTIRLGSNYLSLVNELQHETPRSR